MSSEIDLTSIQVDNQSSSPVLNYPTNVPSISHMPDWMNVKPVLGERIEPINKSLTLATKPPKLPKQKLTSDETIDRRRLILILQFYVLEFPEKLKPYKGTNFEKFKDDELQNLKNEFDFIIGAKCNVKSTQYAFIQGVQLLETLCVTCTPLKINGLSSAVIDDDFLQVCLNLSK